MDIMKCVEKMIEKELEPLEKQARILMRFGCSECGGRNFTMCYQLDETGEAIFQHFRCDDCGMEYPLEEQE